MLDKGQQPPSRVRPGAARMPSGNQDCAPRETLIPLPEFVVQEGRPCKERHLPPTAGGDCVEEFRGLRGDRARAAATITYTPTCAVHIGSTALMAIILMQTPGAGSDRPGTCTASTPRPRSGPVAADLVRPPLRIGVGGGDTAALPGEPEQRHADARGTELRTTLRNMCSSTYPVLWCVKFYVELGCYCTLDQRLRLRLGFVYQNARTPL